jgi:hypothetical protein
MAQSIPPNLEVETLNLKNKTKHQSNIHDRRKRIKKKITKENFTFPPAIQKKNTNMFGTSQRHIKVHCVKHKISKRKHNVYQKYMPIIKINIKTDMCPNGNHGAASGGGGRRPKISLIMSSMALC